jgi:cytochrome c peroxidase
MKSIRLKFVFLLFILLSFGLGMKKSEIFRFKTPKHFPKMIIPEGNEITKARVILGRKLFFDKRLSIDETISCNTCHKPRLAFADNVAVTPGVEGRIGTRNAPTLTNVGFNPRYLFDGFLETLEKQAIVPIEEHAEMAFNIVEVAKRLSQDPVYQKMAQKAYRREMDPFVITRALSTFQRTLISSESPYDLSLRMKYVLGASEERGRKLFFKQLHCTKCHNGFNFTDFSTQNNGLYEVYADSGRMRVSKLESDRDRFKVPTLRNIGLTAPYMHDGSLKTLEEVIRHYESGGKANKNKSQHLLPFQLTNEERQSLIDFLNTLTDYKFIERHAP